MNYFTADVHFSDKKTLETERRPFKNIEQYDKCIIKNFNKVASRNDIIFCVGDLLDCDNETSTSWRDEAPKYIKKINAKTILIMGNNEERIVKYFFNNNFQNFKKWALSIGISDVCKNKIIKENGKKYYLTHQPKNHKDGYINLFGHVHLSTGLVKSYGVNVGVDVNFFRLVTFEDIDKIIARSKKFNYDNDPNINSWF